MKHLGLLLLTLTWCVASQAGQTTELVCPSEVTIKDITVGEVDKDTLSNSGWKTGLPQVRHLQLSGFSLMLGHDEPYADQQADSTSHTKSGKYLSIYTTEGASDVAIRCDYQLGLVRLVKHLEGKYQRCQVSAQMKGKQFNPNLAKFISSHQWTCYK